jgi:hypothetical protein
MNIDATFTTTQLARPAIAAGVLGLLWIGEAMVPMFAVSLRKRPGAKVE